ncbi:MAG: DUF5681 domain-containing protein [Roseiarcus sp.]|jgi:hypothetical protein
MEETDEGPAPDEAVTGKQPGRDTRFKPGKSGNPKGRPKGSCNLSTKILRQLRQPVTVTKGGKPVMMTKADVIANQMVNDSMKGDHKATILVMRIDQEAANAQSAISGESADFAMPDKENLKLIAMRLSRLTEEA